MKPVTPSPTHSQSKFAHLFQPVQPAQPEVPRLTLGSILRCHSIPELKAMMAGYLERIGCPNANVNHLHQVGRVKEANLMAMAETRLAELIEQSSTN